MYLLLRTDLATELEWPTGALVAQGAHAATACIWKFKDDPEVIEYMNNIDSLAKVVLQVLGILIIFLKF